MRNLFNSLTRRTVLPAIAVGALLSGAAFGFAEDVKPIVPAPATDAAAPAESTFADARLIVVEWKIKKGHEQEFLTFYSTKSVVGDRSGLIAEFMTTAESKDKYPWIQWASVDNPSPDYTTFYNIGIWRKADDFYGQIGKYIDINRPSLPFEADKRHRVLLQPLEWRIGMSKLPAQDAPGVK